MAHLRGMLKARLHHNLPGSENHSASNQTAYMNIPRHFMHMGACLLTVCSIRISEMSLPKQQLCLALDLLALELYGNSQLVLVITGF